MKFLQHWLNLTIVSAILIACEQVPMSKEELSLHYFTNSESTYTDIKVEQGQLTYTYFEDTENRCAQWFKSTPCWTKDDLKTITTALDANTEAALRKIISEQHGLQQVATSLVSNNTSMQRAYSQKLDIRLGSFEQHLDYHSRPDAPPKPAAFEQIEQILQNSADQAKANVSK